MELRDLRAPDAKKLTKLWADVPWLAERDPAVVRKMLAQPSTTYLGAFEGTVLIGALGGIVDPFRVYVDDVAVHPDHRRAGVAKALFAELISRFGDDHDLIFYAHQESAAMASKEGFRLQPAYQVWMRPFR